MACAFSLVKYGKKKKKIYRRSTLEPSRTFQELPNSLKGRFSGQLSSVGPSSTWLFSPWDFDGGIHWIHFQHEKDGKMMAGWWCNFTILKNHGVRQWEG